jgi:hypothetical protein
MARKNKNSKPEKAAIQTDEVKKWAGDIVDAAKATINEVVDSIKEQTDDLGKKQLSAKLEKDRLLLKPVFAEMLPSSQPTSSSISSLVPFRFTMPDIINVVEKDKKHAESKACDHSLGHLSIENGLPVLNVYPHHMKDLGITFFPDMKKGIYYVDPYQKDHYIYIEDYFSQLKTARVNELEKLAYCLGATHAEILFKTNTVELEKAKKKADLGVKKGKKKLVDVKAEHSESESKKESMEVAKVINASGHDDPQVPDLVYFKNDEDIQNLIFMRMDNKSKLTDKECSIKYSNSSGIKSADAAKIQGAVDKLGGGSAGVSITDETLTENYMTLIYKIVF